MHQKMQGGRSDVDGGEGKTVTARFALVVLCAVLLSSPLQAQTLSVFYTFTPDIGAGPEGNLVADGQGNLYGTSTYGGRAQVGTIYKIDTHGTPTLLYAFTGKADGGVPEGGLVRDAAGNLYGTTFQGGILGGSCPSLLGCGVVFKLSPSGKLTPLHAFTGGADGSAPGFFSLTADGAGNLYGTTLGGGNLAGSCALNAGCGVVFKISLAGKFGVLYTFNGTGDGSEPRGTLFRDRAGNLYGTTLYGGVKGATCPNVVGCGVVYKVTMSGKETVVHSFSGGADGSGSQAGLVSDGLGNLYGGTEDGGTSKFGTVFELSPAGNKTILFNFSCGNGACGPDSLTRDPAGNLYGVSFAGNGSVFKLDVNENLTVIHAFVGGSDGVHPLGGLVFNTATHSLFGTTFFAGDQGDCASNGCGVVYQVEP